jgi:hypothetical protein
VSHGFLYSIVVPACSACDLIGVLTDPGSRRCRGDFCTHRGVASRVLLTGVLVLYRARRGGTSLEQDTKAPGMVAQGWGWTHKAGCDRGNVLRLPRVTTPSWAVVRSAAVRSSRVLPSLFERCDMEEGRERVAQCQGMTPATPHSTRTAPGMATQWRAICTTSGSDSHAASRDRRGEDSPFDPGARGVSGHLMLRPWGSLEQ